MPKLRVNWTLPTTRESGQPLTAAQIKHVLIELSADKGANYVPIGTFPPTVLTTDIQDVDFGEWTVRGRVVDVDDRVSQPVMASITIADQTPPGALLTLTLALV